MEVSAIKKNRRMSASTEGVVPGTALLAYRTIASSTGILVP